MKAGILRQGTWIWIFLLLALRFVLVGDTIFILDEPLFQMRIDDHFANGTFPLSSFRGSSIPLPYGPGAIWFYMAARIFTWHPYALAIYHTAAVTAGAFFFFSAIRRKFGEESARWSGLLLASSPLLFFFSRHPWDNTLLFTLGAILIWCFVRLEESNRESLIHAVMGVIVGYALNIHLMFGSIAIATGLALIFRAQRLHGFRTRNFWIPLLAFGGAAFLTMLPYLWEAFRIMQVEQPLEHTKHNQRWGDGRNLWWLLQRSLIFSSIWGGRIYLDTVHQQFEAWVGQPLAFLFHNDLFGWFAKIGALITLLAYSFRLLRGRAPFDTLRVFSVLGLFWVVLVLHYLNIPTAPHYFHPIWWLVFVGVAALIPAMSGWPKKLFLGTLALTAIVNTLFILAAMAFVHENKGARNFSYAVTISEQMRAVREICTEAAARIPPEARVDLERAFILGPAFTYLPNHMPECRGVKFIAERKLPNPTFVLSHPKDSATKVDLVIEWLSPK